MKRENWIWKHKHFFLLLLYGVLQLWFIYLERTIVPEYTMFSKIDLHIPFVKEFVVPYLYWYIYMGAAFLYLGIVSKRDYYKLYIMMFLGMVIAYIIYIIFPNGQNLRPIITENDIFSRTIKLIYSTDTPTNVAPSIHVFNSIAVHIALISCSKLKDNCFIKWSSFIIMVSICASTVFIKQHSIVDGFWGTVLAIILYQVIYVLPIPELYAERKVNKVKRARNQMHWS